MKNMKSVKELQKMRYECDMNVVRIVVEMLYKYRYTSWKSVSVEKRRRGSEKSQVQTE
jgi:hypothetical protein